MNRDVPINLPADLLAHLEKQAKLMNVDVVGYIRFVTRCSERKLDMDFQRAAKSAFRRFPATLRKLAS